jgi:hypothetical protein
MKRILLAVCLLFILFVIPRLSFAQTRLATCDLCGYCQNSPAPPQKWQECCQCLYPEGYCADPEANKTLEIDPETGSPVSPVKGRMYTFLGCIRTDASFQTDEGTGAVSLVQMLLQIIFSTVGGLAFIYFVYGSFLVLTSQANPEKLNQGKRVIYGALIGVVFSLSAIFIINLIGAGILKIPGFGATLP